MIETLRFRRVLVAAAAAAVLSASGGVASAQLADDDRLDNAWADVAVDQEPILTEAQFAKLNNLAFQAAVTKICDGYDLDQQKFAEGLSDATYPAPDGLSRDEMKQWETAVYFRLGTTYGLFLAEGNAKPDDFCKSAAELKADSTVPNVWQ
jgi:hypothetical protein